VAKMIITVMCTGIYLFFDFFHFQKKYNPTPDRAYTPTNIYIGFTLSPKRYARRRLVAVLIYLAIHILLAISEMSSSSFYLEESQGLPDSLKY